ncbi:GrpB family protein [Paenibacillus sp. OSY-SE]
MAVRDYLRTHSEEAKQYGNVKENLAKQFPKDIVAPSLLLFTESV